MRSQDTMESGGDYDQMLRGMFESCDTVGLGLLTTKDFEKLCMKLSIQEHSSLLSKVLFPETNDRNLLSYETFRDTLILFLTGDSGIGDNPTGDVEARNRSDPEDCWSNSKSYEFIDDTRFNLSPKSGMISKYSNDVFSCEADKSLDIDAGNRGYNRGNSSPPLSGSPRKSRRYGRRSKPDMDLLRNRESSGDPEPPAVSRVEQDEHDPSQQDESFPEKSPWKAVEVSFVAEEETETPITMKDEEFTGQGKDENWKNPDCDWIPDTDTRFEGSFDNTAVKTVQTELENAWSKVVGSPASDAMVETRLGALCSELGLGQICRPEDISELFAALDGDDDGLVTFLEFSEQMSTYIGGTNTDSVELNPAGVEPEIVRGRSEGDSRDINLDVINTACDNVFTSSDVFAEENEESLLQQEFNVTLLGNDVSANYHSSTSRPITPVGASDIQESAIELVPAESTPVRTETNSTLSPLTFVTSAGSHTSSSRSQLSLDSDTSPLCPPVVPVEPRQLAAINRGRRRRRLSAVAASNPAGVRQQRRKTRSIPLPHYHPDSIRRLEQMPLSYLTEENERYISLEALQHAWEAEGLIDSSQILEALELKATEQSISVEALTEVFEMESDQNLVHKAALILYREGLKYYRSHYEYEREERSKQDSREEHLVAQLQENKKLLEEVETKLKKQTAELETKYKVEIRSLNEEIASVRAKVTQGEQESLASHSAELIDMTKRCEKSQTLAQDLKEKNRKLLQLKEEAESKLLAAEEYVTKTRETLTAACRKIASSSRRTAARKRQIRELLLLLEEEDQSMTDEDEEMIGDLQQACSSWPSSRWNSSESARRKVQSLRHDDVCEESNCHRSTCQVFVQDLSKSVTPSTVHFMTSSLPSERPEEVVSKSDVFLTPGVTRSKPRVVQSHASLVMASPISLPENRSDS